MNKVYVTRKVFETALSDGTKRRGTQNIRWRDQIAEFLITLEFLTGSGSQDLGVTDMRP